MDEIGTGALDQMEARVRDLVDANGLEIVDRAGVDVEWVATATGPEVLAGLLSTALAATADGYISAMVALPSGPGTEPVGVQLLVLRRKDRAGG